VVVIAHALLVASAAAVVAVPCAEAASAIVRHTFRLLTRHNHNGSAR